MPARKKPIAYSVTASGCHECTSHCRDDAGYPRVYDSTTRNARPLSNVIWEQHNGTLVPPGMVVRHSCDNPPCINPEHLLLGTRADNAADCVSRGRTRRGPKKPRLTPEAVADIKTSDEPQRVLAERYGVTRVHVAKIQTGRHWKGHDKAA